MRKTLFYDCEIVNCIPDKYFSNPNYSYCKGWEDFEGMGVACVAVYTNWQGWFVFLGGELNILQELINEAEEIVGFNSLSFDDKLLQAHDVNIHTTYDLLRETRLAAGMPAEYVRGITRKGYTLSELATFNTNKSKSGNGAYSPMLWQDGKYESVIDYCKNDVGLLVELYQARSHLIDPTNREVLLLRGGSWWKHWLSKRKKRLAAKKANALLNKWAVFWWAIVHSDARECKINIVPPLEIRFSQTFYKAIYITFRLPEIYVSIPYEIRQEYHKYKLKEHYEEF